MPRNENRRRRKLEARNAKRKEQKKAITRIQSAGISARMRLASQWPVVDARVSGSLWEQGIGYVAIARRGTNHQVAGAIFLVDVYCLGVKDAILFFDAESRWFDAVSKFKARGGGWIDVSAEHARKLVEGAVAYARRLELEPHPDFHSASQLFGDIDADQCMTEFTYGKDGMPLFISGPFDTPDRVQRIMQSLTKTAGAGNFHYLLGFSGIGPEDDDEPSIAFSAVDAES